MNTARLSMRLQRIRFDPLSYLHPQRVQIPARLINTPTARTAVNDILLRSYALDWQPFQLDALAKQWIHHWYRLPHVAYLIGCHSLRADLAWKGNSCKLPHWANNFMRLTLPTEISTGHKVIGDTELLTAGYTRLHPWVTRLPQPLAQRFPLQFPAAIEMAINDTAPQAEADPLILTLALQYAERYPNISSTRPA